jgi:hypothetical protein
VIHDFNIRATVGLVNFVGLKKINFVWQKTNVVSRKIDVTNLNENFCLIHLLLLLCACFNAIPVLNDQSNKLGGEFFMIFLLLFYLKMISLKDIFW